LLWPVTALLRRLRRSDPSAAPPNPGELPPRPVPESQGEGPINA
jgi:hypothetical protein